ncbi:cleavage stimulation factor subunit 2-like isoform X2 [Ptychodera flava]|uniref:cleavage stimulation factor subunit 2-like isoform X2 n=1 Tax=Ptychodera flava TaxID=63121 RepID=UPI00396A6924
MTRKQNDANQALIKMADVGLHQQNAPQVNQATDRSLRSVFVGNIPYEATEEQLKDIFSEVGPVVSFRLVYDRETGKPKGYGFCEYKDQETALSAMRNLSGYELNGRQLRVDNAASEKNKEELKNLHAAGPPQESPYGDSVPPNEAPEAISKAVASLPPEQMFELMKQMKMVIQNNPVEARNMLLQNPQLAYALLQAQVVMRIVSPEIAMAMLHKPQNPVQPLVPPGSIAAAVPQQQQGQGPGPGPGPMQLMEGQNMGGPMGSQGMPINNSQQPMQQKPMPMPMQQMQPGPGQGQQPMGPGQGQQPMGPGPMDHPGPMGDQRMMGPGPGMGGPGPGMGGPGPSMGGPGPGMGGPGPSMGGPGPGMGGPGPGMGGPGPGQVPMQMQGMQGHPGQGPPRPNRPGLLGDAPTQSMERDPRARQDPRSLDPRGGGPGPRGPPGQPQPSRGVPQGGPRMGAPQGLSMPNLSGGPGPGASPGQITAQDQEKAALIMQVLQLTPEQVAMLPPDQRQSIMILKDQIARSSGAP